jgi:aminopeptidase N
MVRSSWSARSTFAVTMMLGAVAACGDDGTSGPPPSCLPDCPASRDYDAVAYHLEARFDAAAKLLRAEETITLQALSGPIVELDAEVDVSEVRGGGQRLAFARDPDERRLWVDLGPLTAADTPVPISFTVTYTAGLSDALVYAGPRDDDPVASTVLYTDSEPDRGLRWLVAKHDPADRARFSVELTVAPSDDVISNGARVKDELTGGARVVGYQLAPPIPTYLMAFAAGPLEHTDRTTGRVPLSLWYRRGLVLDPAATLDAVADAMATFEDRLGPYPFERYSVVLLPQFGGGMENATITFNSELSSQGVVSFSLNAHELAHQWFGDQVTMRTYDDLWTKEGMATFLQVEADRARRDRAGVGRSFGSDFLFLSSSAVVDPSLTGLAKYTDGPYDRAAWVITQIRRRVGDEAFWAGLRKVLADHALDSVDSEGFVRAFAPALDEATITRILASLRAKVLPRVALTTTATGGALDGTLALDDPDAVLIAPIELAVIDAAGVGTSLTVGTTPTPFTVPVGGYVAPDERGVHPSWSRTFGTVGADFGRLNQRYAPLVTSAGPAMTSFLARSPVHQERGILGMTLPPPADLRATYDALDSLNAQEALLTWTCNRLPNLDGAEAAGTVAAVESALRAPPLVRYNLGYLRCPIDLATRLFGAELTAAVAAPTAANAARLEYLISYDYGTATNLAQIGRLATTAPTLRLRERAFNRLVAETAAGAPRRIPVADRPTWQVFFREAYAVVTSQNRLMLLWQGSVNLADIGALRVVAPLLQRVPMSEFNQWLVVCEAHRMTATDPAAWAQFQADTMPWATLTPAAAAALADPAQCDQARVAPRAPVDPDDAHDERARLRH